MSGIAVVLGVIQEQMAEHGRKLDSIAAVFQGYETRLRSVEMELSAIVAEWRRPPSQWPAVAGGVAAIASITFAFFAVLYTH